MLLKMMLIKANDSATANCIGSSFCFLWKNICIIGPSEIVNEKKTIASIKYIFSLCFIVLITSLQVLKISFVFVFILIILDKYISDIKAGIIFVTAITENPIQCLLIKALL